MGCWARWRSVRPHGFAHCGNKWFSRLRRGHSAGQDAFEIHHAPVEFARGVFVLVYYGAVKGDAGKQAACARICQHSGAHLPVGGAFGVTPDGPRSYGSIGPELKLTGEERRHATI